MVDSWAWRWSGVWGEQLADLVAPLCPSRSAKCERLVENREDGSETICSEDRGPKRAASWEYGAGERLSRVCIKHG